VPCRPCAEILTIGNELLNGRTLNTNARFLGRALTGLGFEVGRQTSCPDEPDKIRLHLGAALEHSDLVIVSGGLGPTPDDVTREAVAGFFRVPLKLSRIQYQRIVSLYRARRKKVPAGVRIEALFPANARPLINRYGVALGFMIEMGHRMVIVLPGVPSELEQMFRSLILPLLRRRYPAVRPRHLLVVKTAGISEPEIMERLGPAFFKGLCEFGIYPHYGHTTLRIYGEQAAALQKLKRHIGARLKSYIFAWEDIELAEVIRREMMKRKRTMATAESCTGGKLASELTAIPGASGYFRGGVIAYANEVKTGHLGVDSAILRQYGAVSRQTAIKMALGVRRKMSASYGISVTGIAGPGGGSKDKPIGTVYVALADERGCRCWHHRFVGNREQIRTRIVRKSMEYLWRALLR